MENDTVGMAIRDTCRLLSRTAPEVLRSICQGRQRFEQGYHVGHPHLLADIDCPEVLLRKDLQTYDE